jgi:hypothetical protein
MTAPAAIPVEQMHDAIDRIARTADGRELYLYCQRRLMGVSTDNSEGALRSDHGERMFAARLIGLMAKGIADSGGRTSSSGTSGTGSGEQPIVFAVREPVRVAGSGRAGSRRVTADTRVPGWSEPESGSSE